jgi:hypothetical protein
MENTLLIEEIELIEDKLDIEKMKRRLPDDVLRKIYDNYFSPEQICNKLQSLLVSKECCSLYYFELGEYLENVVFKEPLAVNKLKKENPLFLQIYHEEIVLDRRHFVKFENKYQSFALAWLMYLYH